MFNRPFFQDIPPVQPRTTQFQQSPDFDAASLYDIVDEYKALIAAEPERAKELLTERPDITRDLLDSVLLLGLHPRLPSIIVQGMRQQAQTSSQQNLLAFRLFADIKKRRDEGNQLSDIVSRLTPVCRVPSLLFFDIPIFY